MYIRFKSQFVPIIYFISNLFQRYSSGKMLTGELKQELITVLAKLVGEHRKRRADVTDNLVNEYMKSRKLKFDY